MDAASHVSPGWSELFDEARNQNGLGNRTRAEELVELSIIEADKLPEDSASYASAQMGFALWYLHSGNGSAAEFHQIRAIKAESNFVRGREIASMLLYLADMLKMQEKSKEAIATIELAISKYPDGYTSELSGAYFELSELLTKVGEIEEAADAKAKSERLKDL